MVPLALNLSPLKKRSANLMYVNQKFSRTCLIRLARINRFQLIAYRQRTSILTPPMADCDRCTFVSNLCESCRWLISNYCSLIRSNGTSLEKILVMKVPSIQLLKKSMKVVELMP